MSATPLSQTVSPLIVLLSRGFLQRTQLGLEPKEGFKLSEAARARRQRKKADSKKKA